MQIIFQYIIFFLLGYYSNELHHITGRVPEWFSVLMTVILIAMITHDNSSTTKNKKEETKDNDTK